MVRSKNKPMIMIFFHPTSLSVLYLIKTSDVPQEQQFELQFFFIFSSDCSVMVTSSKALI